MSHITSDRWSRLRPDGASSRSLARAISEAWVAGCDKSVMASVEVASSRTKSSPYFTRIHGTAPRCPWVAGAAPHARAALPVRGRCDASSARGAPQIGGGHPRGGGKGCAVARQHDVAGLEHVAVVGDGERCARVLFDQHDGD